MLFAWKCVYIRVHPSIFRVGPARSTLSSVLMCVAKLNELRGDPLLLFSILFFFGWCHSVMWLTARPTVKDRTSEREEFFSFFFRAFFFLLLHPEGEKTEERGKKEHLGSSLFSDLGFFLFFYFLFFGFARMCRLFYPREENPGRSFFHSGARMYLLSRMCSRRTTCSGRKGERGGS